MFTTKHLSLRLTNPRVLFQSDKESAILRFDAAPDNNSIALPNKQTLYVDNEEQQNISFTVSIADATFKNSEAGLLLWINDSIEVILSAKPKQFAQIINCATNGVFPKGLEIAIKEGLTAGMPGRFEIAKDEYERSSWNYSIKPE